MSQRASAVDSSRARTGGRSPRPRQVPFALRLITGLAALTLLGTLLFFLPGVTTRPFRIDEALFTAVSSLTVTGLLTINPAVDLTPTGQALLAVLIQIGGIGFMILAVILLRLLGRRITFVDRIALRNALGGVMPGAVLSLIWRILAGLFVIEAIGTLLLWLHWRGRFASDLEALGYAVFHAISAFCNAGIDLFTGSQAFTGGLPSDSGTLFIFSFLIITGGLGVPVIADLLTLPRDRRLALHTRITLVMVFGLILFGAVGTFLAEFFSGRLPPPEAWPARFGLATFQSILVRSAGFGLAPGFHQLTPGSQFLMLLLMFVGAAPASMGGGITTGTAAVLLIAMWSYALNWPYPLVSSRRIATQTVWRALAVLIVSLLVITSATWLLLVSHPGVPVINALFEVVSAFATCGLTLAFTAQLNPFGQLIIMLVMFWGRLGPLTVVVALARRPSVQPVVQHPEEQILIG
jgi:trk system potassium uptake protein TrkH